MAHPPAPRRLALLSVSDKDGLVRFAEVLREAGYDLLSTGGTMKALEEAKIPVRSVEDFTGFPACLGGRLKTLHPKIFGGILYKRGDPTHEAEAANHGLEPIDLVVVNLYPFRTTVQKLGINITPGDPLPDAAIEQIDIGGPSLLRAAAKNHESVTVICDPHDYGRVADDMKKNGDVSDALRRALAHKAYAHTAVYDGNIAETFSGGTEDHLFLIEGRSLRYGENPHQWGRFYEIEGSPTQCWKQHSGKELSYLNLLDGDAAWRMVCDFAAPAAVLVKHANPSGIAISDASVEDAFQRAYDADRLSAFGVIVAINRPCTAALAQSILDQKIFVEVLLAPVFEPAALTLLSQKPNLRLLEMGNARFSESSLYRSAFGGMLVQNDDVRPLYEADLTCVTSRKPSPAEVRDLLFAWQVVKHAKSNAIVFARDGVTVGIGCGQTSRVDATWIALKRAGDKAKGAMMASDAFFPFPDSLDEAAKHGIAAVIQPGGSIRDAEVIRKAEDCGISMLFTGVRGFRH